MSSLAASRNATNSARRQSTRSVSRCAGRGGRVRGGGAPPGAPRAEPRGRLRPASTRRATRRRPRSWPRRSPSSAVGWASASRTLGRGGDGAGLPIQARRHPGGPPPRAPGASVIRPEGASNRRPRGRPLAAGASSPDRRLPTWTARGHAVTTNRGVRPAAATVLRTRAASVGPPSPSRGAPAPRPTRRCARTSRWHGCHRRPGRAAWPTARRPPPATPYARRRCGP